MDNLNNIASVDLHKNIQSFGLVGQIPETIQMNLTLVASDTALDFKVLSNVGCVSSANWAITLQRVLLNINI